MLLAKVTPLNVGFSTVLFTFNIYGVPATTAGVCMMEKLMVFPSKFVNCSKVYLPSPKEASSCSLVAEKGKQTPVHSPAVKVLFFSVTLTVFPK